MKLFLILLFIKASHCIIQEIDYEEFSLEYEPQPEPEHETDIYQEINGKVEDTSDMIIKNFEELGSGEVDAGVAFVENEKINMNISNNEMENVPIIDDNVEILR